MFSPYAAMGNSPGMMIDPNGEMTMYAEPVQDGDYAVHGGMDAVAVREFMANGAHGMFGKLLMLGMNTILTAVNGGGGKSIAVEGNNIYTNGAAAQELFALLFKSNDLSENETATASGNNYNSGSISPVDNVAYSNDRGQNGILDKKFKDDSVNDIVVSASKYANHLEEYYETKSGGTYHISTWRFYDIIDEAKKNGAIEYHRAVYDPNTEIYSVPVNLYKTDYWASFGRATLMYQKSQDGKIYFTGFRDTWDLDTKSWGTRSIPAEVITRYYNWLLDGNNFKVSYP